MMRCLTVLVILALYGLTAVSGSAFGPLPCDSFLRRLPAFSHLFTHCDCLRSEWSDWLAINRTAVPDFQCPSESALTYQRRQRRISGECQDIVENKTICEPDLADRIILSLGLGSSRPPDLLISLRPLTIVNLNQTRPSRDTEQVCIPMTVPHGRRSVREELKSPRLNKRLSSSQTSISGSNIVQPLKDAIPFNLMEHGSRFRRQSCGSEIQHILFVLDTSGSVGQANFQTVTRVLADLTSLFCNTIKIAVMTFDHEYYVEFCFDDYGSNRLLEAANDIRSIPYIRPGQSPGTRWTHTAGAAQCACEYMLNPTHDCLNDFAPECVNVIFVTDGHANDPNLDVCTEIRCLHRRRGVNTFAIGIGNRDDLQLECMREDDLELDEYHLFNFETFAELEEQFNEITRRFLANDGYECADVATNPVG